MIILDAVTKSLELLLGGVVTTNQLPFVVSYVDVTTSAYSPLSNDGLSNNATAVSLVSAPAASTQRQVKLITVKNEDTVVTVVTIRLNNSGTFRKLVEITLPVGATLIYTDGEGFRVISSGGLILVGSTDNAISNFSPGGRLTLTSGVPVTTSDVTAATTVYYTPYINNLMGLYNGIKWDNYSFSELAIALGTDAVSLPYDVFAYINAGTVAIERLAWASGTARATALVRQNGILCKSGDLTRRYLGSYRTTSVAGQTEDSGFQTANSPKRFVWNYYNRVSRPMRRIETASSWAYSIATLRQANANVANRVEFVIGRVEDAVLITVIAETDISVSAASRVSIGEDNTTTQADGVITLWVGNGVSGEINSLQARLLKFPTDGYHYYAWLEKSNGVGTATWRSGALGTDYQTGIFATVEG